MDIPSYVEVPRPNSSKRTRLRSEMLFRMFAASFISTMKVDSPREILSEAPTRVNILSTYPDLGRRGRDETSGLRHDDDECRLAQEGGFTRHVGSGDDDDLLFFVVEVEIIVNVILPGRQLFLDHGMASRFDVNDERFVDLGAVVIVGHGNVGKRDQRVYLRDDPGIELDGTDGRGCLCKSSL